jgi:predicted PurR-regulated permease PerM
MLGFNVDFILLLAITAGLTEFIPYIGPLLGAIPAVLVGLTDSPTTALAVAVLYFVIQQLENQFLVPRIVGDSLNVHPAILMMTLLIGASLLGILGVILSAPLTAIGRDVFLYLYNRLKDPPPRVLAASPTDLPGISHVSEAAPLVAPPTDALPPPVPPAAPVTERTISQ